MELNTEQKQRINLSLHAQDVLTIDREQFAPQLTSSGFINELLFRYAPQAEASVTENLERRRKNILMQLETIKMPELNRRAVADALLNPVREELVRKSAAFPRGTSVIFRLNNRNRDLFYDRDWKDAVYYDRRPSKYMKALIEEYASHTAFQREAFYFQEWITLAETAADAGKLLRFTTSNSRNELVIWDMRVYGVFPNEAGLFHYIVGRCVRKGGIKSDERIASFRISRMNEVKILSTASSRSGNLSKAEKKEIEAKIKEVIYNVPFDKKFDEPTLDKLAPLLRPYFEKENDFLTFMKALPIEWKRVNFDEPSVYNLKEAAQDIALLSKDGKCEEKIYSKVVSERLPSSNILNGRKYDTIIVEGIYALSPSFLNELGDKESAIKNFVDGNPKSLFLRRILRDEKMTSADSAFTMNIYFRYIVKSYEETILPNKKNADVVFDNEMSFEEMHSGDLYTTKSEVVFENPSKGDKLLKASKILSETYQRDYFFRVPGEEEKSENVLRLRLLSKDQGKTYLPSSIVHKGIPKVRKDHKIIRPINVLLKEGDFSKVFASTEECLTSFEKAGFIVSAPVD